MRPITLVLFFFVLLAAPFTAFAQDCSQDGDFDGVSDCDDVCPDDSFNTTTPGDCGCGAVEFDVNDDDTFECVESCNFNPLNFAASCRCPVFELMFQLIGIPFQCGRGPSFNNRTIITEPPVAVVMRLADGSSAVQFFFQTFGRASTASARGRRPPVELEKYVAALAAKQGAGKNKLSTRYELNVSSAGPVPLTRKRTSKKNTVTVNGLPPGDYIAKYRALGVNSDNKIVVKTKFSPTKSFTIPE